jgi:hypothetical protein
MAALFKAASAAQPPIGWSTYKEEDMQASRFGAGLGLLLWAAASPGAAHAAVTEDNFQLRSATDLLTLCTADPTDRLMTAAANFCHGYALGVFQTLDEEQGGMRSKLFCITEPRPTRTQAIAAFVDWLKPKQDVQSMRPADAILAYLRDAYPCGKKR